MCDLPEIKRCCFCIPLRYGLIAWGYIALCINFIYLFDKIEKIDKILKKDDQKDNSIAYESFQLVMMLADLAFVIIFVVAAHMKHVKLLKISFIGNLTSVILYTLWCLYMFWTVSQLLHFLSAISSDKSQVNSLYWMLAGVAAGSAVEILMKLYIMFLLRKEIKKLEANCVFSFVNNMTQAKCNMKDVELEKGTFQQIKVDDVIEGFEGTSDITCET